MTQVVHAGCKINLYLEIKGLRQDGYHELVTLFYPLSHPHDILTFSTENVQGLDLSCTDPALQNEENILAKTYFAFCQHTKTKPDVRIHLKKSIPMGAGLGGGSSDAAAFLNFLNSSNPQTRLKQEELLSLASLIGADVPFFLINRPCLAAGIGDKLKPVDVDLTGFYLVMICPEISISTIKAYALWDALYSTLAGTLTRSYADDKKLSFCSGLVLFNSFEQAVFPDYPILREIKLQMLTQGASGCVMSGSGSSMSAFFRSSEAMKNACVWLERQNYPYFIHKM